MGATGTAGFADIVLFLVALPFALWAAWGDLKHMRITNKMNLVMAATFIVVGIFILPIEDYGLRIAYGFAALAIGFLMNIAGLMGGGDAKYIAAFTPFLAPPDVPFFIVILMLSLLAAVVVHRIAGLLPPVKAVTDGWVSFAGTRGKKFPMGFALSGALLLYLAIRAFNLPVGLG